jgi:anti-sigma regulatory factor (Ser/Thr protein kinase)
MIYRRTFAGVPASVPEVRRYAASVLNGVPQPILETALLAVSELATNAVLHAASPFEVAIDIDTERVIVDVADNGSGSAAPRRARPTEEGGRGLHIVGALADAWGVRKSTPEWRKSIWFSLRLATKPAPV